MGAAGLRCSPSLVELFRALCAVAEDNAAVLAAHPTYASLVERTLSKVVLVHVATLERLCQVRRLRVQSASHASRHGTCMSSVHSWGSDLHICAQTFSQPSNHLKEQKLLALSDAAMRISADTAWT